MMHGRQRLAQAPGVGLGSFGEPADAFGVEPFGQIGAGLRRAGRIATIVVGLQAGVNIRQIPVRQRFGHAEKA